MPDPERALKTVTFSGTILPAWRQALTGRGIAVRGYLPDDTLVVVASARDVHWLRGLPVVRVVGDAPLYWKVDPTLLRAGAGGTALAAGRRDVVVELADAGARGPVEVLLRQAGGQMYPIEGPADAAPRMLRAHVDVARLLPVLRHVDVAAVEPDAKVRTLNDQSYGWVQAAAPQHATLWDHGLHGEAQIVASCDAGVSTNSCFFPSEKIVAYDTFVTSPARDHAHGTHVAGSIAGDQLGNRLYDQHDGMAPAARLYIQDASTEKPDELTVPADMGGLLGAAYRAGARVHANAWGGEKNTYGARERSLDAFVASHRDFLMVAAAGNDGDRDGTVVAPGTAKNLITVGAFDTHAPDDVAVFSSHGPTPDGRFKPTLVAPGQGVVSAQGDAACQVAAMTGTSAATAMVAGAAALVRQYYMEGFYPSGGRRAEDRLTPSAALVKATLLAGADDMVGLDTDGPRPANGQGFGRLHADGALPWGAAPPRLWTLDAQEGLGVGEVQSVTLEVKAGTPLRLALAWMDEPAMPAADRALVNDLDLSVEGPEGRVWLGNGAGAALADHVNVEEVVTLAIPSPGVYRVRVSGHDVPLGPQPFALVVSGDMTAQSRAP